MGHSSHTSRNEHAANQRSLLRIFIAATLTVTAFFALSALAFGQTATTGPAKADAVFQQAKAFHDGTNVPKDLRKARSLYKQAANMGSTYACINLGYMYFTGEGVPKNFGVSRQWYRAAANNGNSDAQRMMSVFYKNGLGVAGDPNAASLWAERAQSGWVKPAAPMSIKSKKPADITDPVSSSKPVAITGEIVHTNVPNAAEAAKARRLAALSKRKAEARALKAAAASAALSQTQNNRARAKTGTADTPVPAVVIKKSAAIKTATQDSANGMWLLVLTAGALVLFGAIAVITEKYRRVKEAHDNSQFVRAFYARHRAILRASYATAQENKGVIISNPQDPWVQSALIMMIKFAQKHEIVTGNPMRLTTDVIRALQKDAKQARVILMPLMPRVEDVLIDDLSGTFIKDAPKAAPAQIALAMLGQYKGDRRGSGLSAAQ